jgi:hypothetical protein
MDEVCRILILQEIERIWKTFNKNMQPNGVWIAEYRTVPLEFESNFPDEIPERVYFLDKTGILEKEVGDFQKFITFSENPIRYKNDHTFEIGLSMLAMYEDSEDFYYFCYQFGGRFGKGYQIKFNNKGEVTKYKNIWAS